MTGVPRIIHANGDEEVTIAFPGGIDIVVALAGKSLDLRATVKGRPALVRTEVDARSVVTVDIVERRASEE
jgi:hypothetical protein